MKSKHGDDYNPSLQSPNTYFGTQVRASNVECQYFISLLYFLNQNFSAAIFHCDIVLSITKIYFVPYLFRFPDAARALLQSSHHYVAQPSVVSCYWITHCHWKLLFDFFWISLFAFEMKTVRRRRWGQPQMTQTFCHCRRPNDILSHNQIPNDSCSDNFAFLHKNITWRNRSSSLHTSNRLLKSGFNLILTGKERFWTRSTFNIQRKI